MTIDAGKAAFRGSWEPGASEVDPDRESRRSRDELLARRGLYDRRPDGQARAFAPRVGDVFGELTVERAIAFGKQGPTRWLCRCDCGNEAIRSGSALVAAVRAGRRPCCHDCRNEMFRSLATESRQRVNAARRALFAVRGTLYSVRANERIGREVRAALEEEFGPVVELEGPPEVLSGWQPPDDPSPLESKLADLYPIASETHAWACVDCRATFERGLGCVSCIEPTCVACVRAGRHRCNNADGCHALDVVGERVNHVTWAQADGQHRPLSRERVRQMQNEALSKLRRSPVILELILGDRSPCAGFVPGSAHVRPCALVVGHRGSCLPLAEHDRESLEVRRARELARARVEAAALVAHLADLEEEVDRQARREEGRRVAWRAQAAAIERDALAHREMERVRCKDAGHRAEVAVAVEASWRLDVAAIERDAAEEEEARGRAALEHEARQAFEAFVAREGLAIEWRSLSPAVRETWARTAREARRDRTGSDDAGGEQP